MLPPATPGDGYRCARFYGLAFTVTPGKTGFRGAEEHARLEGRERFKIYGVLVDGDAPTDAGDELWSGASKIRVVTSAITSPLATSTPDTLASTTVVFS